MDSVLQTLNQEGMQSRLDALRQLVESKGFPPVLPQYANNHIHTFYSFSPYSPTAAVYFARQAGLATCGIVDHDTLAGAKEFIEAGCIAGVETTVGIECRVSLQNTPLAGRRINNPDQKSLAYMVLHGVPHTQIDRVQRFFEPLRQKRNRRNRLMVERLNALTAHAGIRLSFEQDVLPLSRSSEGGSVTERHLLYALALAVIDREGRGAAAVGFTQKVLGISLSEAQRAQLLDAQNPHYAYDLLGVFKGELAPKMYVEATDECLHIHQLVQLAGEVGAILCYAYLGDVTHSVTGDKRTQKFEDDYLDLLFEFMAEQGIDAITYMPSRNSPRQLQLLQKKCRQYGFLEISGEDINSPRQSFICKQLAQPEFAHLLEATRDLIAYEKRATEGVIDKSFPRSWAMRRQAE